MNYSSLSRFMSLVDGVEALTRSGLSEDEAKPFLIEAILDRVVAFRGPPNLSGLKSEPEATDWEGSQVRDYLYAAVLMLRGGGSIGGGASRAMTPISISRADVENLCKRIEAERPAASRPGRKPHGATRDGEILTEFDRMIEAGEVSFVRGGKTAAARAILAKIDPGYKLDTIMRMIRKAFEEHADK